MTKPTVVVAAHEEALARLAAAFIVRCARESQPQFCVALSGGSTPRPLYRLLASAEHQGAIPWEAVHVFFADERAVPADHPDSNFGMIDGLLLSRVPLPRARVHRMCGEAANLSLAAKEYEWELCKACGFESPCREPILDLVLLGIGDDGHTASLFPDTAALTEEDRWVVANYVPKLSAHRLTLTYPAIAAAREVAFLASGASKAEIVRRVLAGDASLPATRAAARPRVTFLLDEAAASALSTEWRDNR